jgi:hypothetical protein
MFLIFIVMYVPYSYCYVCSILCIPSHCVVLLFVCEYVLDNCHRDIGALFDNPN